MQTGQMVEQLTLNLVVCVQNPAETRINSFHHSHFIDYNMQAKKALIEYDLDKLQQLVQNQ